MERRRLSGNLSKSLILCGCVVFEKGMELLPHVLHPELLLTDFKERLCSLVQPSKNTFYRQTETPLAFGAFTT